MSSTSTTGLLTKYYATLFDPEEGLCLAYNAQGRSVTPVADALNFPRYADLQYIGINPLVGHRLDDNVTAYRSFLFENDKIDLAQQVAVIKASGLPYSAAVFSGNKSVHYVVSLETPLPDRATYDFVWKWIFNILCDQLPLEQAFDAKTKNPSRFSRAPEGTNVKVDDQGVEFHRKRQKLLVVNGRIPDQTMNDWLMAHQDKMPVIKKYDHSIPLSTTAQPMWLSNWTQHLLDEGIFNGKRNDEWFKMAFDFIECGFNCEEALGYVEAHAKNLGDFPRKEIETTFKSAYKTNDRRQGQ